jgi:hypothetical protein
MQRRGKGLRVVHSTLAWPPVASSAAAEFFATVGVSVSPAPVANRPDAPVTVLVRHDIGDDARSERPPILGNSAAGPRRTCSPTCRTSIETIRQMPARAQRLLEVAGGNFRASWSSRTRRRLGGRAESAATPPRCDCANSTFPDSDERDRRLLRAKRDRWRSERGPPPACAPKSAAKATSNTCDAWRDLSAGEPGHAMARF